MPDSREALAEVGRAACRIQGRPLAEVRRGGLAIMLHGACMLMSLRGFVLPEQQGMLHADGLSLTLKLGMFYLRAPRSCLRRSTLRGCSSEPRPSLRCTGAPRIRWGRGELMWGTCEVLCVGQGGAAPEKK